MALKPNQKGIVTGTSKADKVTWIASWNKDLTVNAGNGNDTVNFKNSTYKNKLNGQDGNDNIYGCSNNDTINGGNGNDKLYGYAGNDSIKGGSDNDTIDGGSGNDRLYGETGNDIIKGGNGNDTITGGKGNDKLYTVNGNNTVIFNSGDGSDTLYKGSGSDTLQFNNFANTSKLKSGLKMSKSGNNLVIKYTSNDSITLSNYFTSGSSVTTLKSKDGKTISFSDFYNSYIFNTYTATKGKAFNKTGSSLNDIIKGDSKNDSINGANGNDKLYGYAGNDTIKGGNGNDLIEGGDGDDKLYGNAGNDTIKGGNGKDYIQGDSGNDSIDGGAGNDTIYGNSGNNILKGGTGNDIIYAGIGADIIYAGAGDDNIDLSKSGNNTVYLESGNNKVSKGGFGVDVIYGGTGNDIIYSGEGNDIIDLSKGGTNTVYAEAGNDKIIGGIGNDTIYGGTGNDTINAGKGSNSLYFQTGDGQDTLENGFGSDTLVFSANTKVNIEHVNEDLVVHYGTGDDKVIVTNYNAEHSVQNIKIGNNNYSVNDFEDENIILSRGDNQETVDITPIKSLNIMLTNPFGGENYTYTVTTTSSQTVNLKFLSNGRFRIEGNYLEITSGENQADDIIIWGNHNTISSNNLNDIIRVGGAVDSNGDNLMVQSNENTVNAGLGDDYVIYFGYSNVINADDGDDIALAIGGSPQNNINSAFVRDIDSNTSNSLNGNIDWFNQGLAGGDCRLLSLIQSLSNTVSYSDYVSIIQNDDIYTVTFNNYHNQEANHITVNADELVNFSHVNGDLDVVLTDLGLNKLIYQNKDHDKDSVMTARYNTLADYFFGNEKITYLDSSKTEDYSGKLNELWNAYCEHNINNITIGVVSYTDYELGIIGGHAYALSDINDEYISLINVWDTKDILNLDLDAFYGMETAVFVYGRDYYNQNIILNNFSGSPVNSSDISINAIMQDVISWQDGSSDIQTITSTDILQQNDYLAVTSIIQDDTICQMTI